MITNINGFRAVGALRKAAVDPRIDEIEGGGCEEGRVFIHLKPGYWFALYECSSKTVGNASDVKWLMDQIERRQPT